MERARKGRPVHHVVVEHVKVCDQNIGQVFKEPCAFGVRRVAVKHGRPDSKGLCKLFYLWQLISRQGLCRVHENRPYPTITGPEGAEARDLLAYLDRKSTRLNSSDQLISYAVLC